MSRPLGALIISDSEETGAFVSRAMKQAGFKPAYGLVNSPRELAAALRAEHWDLALASLELSSMSWNDALQIVRGAGLSIPFLVIAEGLPEEEEAEPALHCIESGADDFLPLRESRLVPAIVRALRETEERLELSRTRDRLREAERQYRGMVENAVSGIFRLTPWGELMAANPAANRILGYEDACALMNELRDKGRHSFLDPDEQEKFLFIIEQMGKVEDFEAQVERADGEKIWVCLNAGAVYGDSGEISAIEGGLEDITERKRVESMIIQAKKDWESTFDSVEDIIVVFDGDMRVRRLNWALAKRLEIHPRDAVGKSCEEIFDPGAKKAKVCPRIKTMLGGGERAAEMRIPALDGDFLVTVSRFLGSEDPASEETALVVTAHDVSERKMLEDKLRQSQKMEAIGTLAGGIAHDFNNILGVMMGYSEMCLEQFGAEEAAKKRLKEIIKAGNRASDLIRQILTFSRQEESDLRPLKLAPAVKEIVRMLKASLPSNIEMKVELSGGPDTVRANLTQMHQVILNLCTNAAQAMPETGGAVSLALDLAGHGEEDREARERLGDAPLARLTVEDSGKGIDPAIIHNIFDPFFTTRKGGGGTGMGLALVHGIVTSHGGAVTVQSEPGKGSAFRVYLPLTEGEVEAPAKEEQPAPKAKGRALVVDDEEELAEIGKTMLEGLGFEAVAVSSSLAALETFNREPESFDLLLTDQTMPGLSGAELSARVLARRPDLPVIVCTGFSETLSREKARGMGIREYLLKPVLKKDLSAAIGRIYSTAKA